jgi:hypothetical protein
MAGKIKYMIDKIISERSGGNTIMVSAIRAKIAMKGIAIDEYTSTSEDDPRIIEKLTSLANELNIQI